MAFPGVCVCVASRGIHTLGCSKALFLSLSLVSTRHGLPLAAGQACVTAAHGLEEGQGGEASAGPFCTVFQLLPGSEHLASPRPETLQTR